MTEKANLCASIATTIQTYRNGEIAQPTADHVEHWASQFSEANQLPFLREFNHVMKQTFITEAHVIGYLSSLAQNQNLAGNNPSDFWSTVNFLQIQQAGQSQKAMLSLFDSCLAQHYGGLRLNQCGQPGGAYIYLDDVLFTGGRIATDLKAWIDNVAPAGAKST